jgi:hypothetical protein
MTVIEVGPHKWGWRVFEALASSLCSVRKGSRLIGSVGTSIEVTHL